MRRYIPRLPQGHKIRFEGVLDEDEPLDILGVSDRATRLLYLHYMVCHSYTKHTETKQTK